PIPMDGATRSALTAVHFLVTPNFFHTMRAPILRGRDFDWQDVATSQWVAIVNEAMARRFWPGEGPIGKRFVLDAMRGDRPREVVGVVRDMSLRYVERSFQPVVYTLHFQQEDVFRGFNGNAFGQMTFFVRTSSDPLSVLPAVRQAVAEIDPDRPIANITT